MARMTGGLAAVRSLIANGVDTIFGVPGIQLDHLFNALYDERNRVRVIQSRHEQGCAYMAYGYAASTGRVGTVVVVPGPGLLNATAALSTAYACNAPVLCLAGQIPSQSIGRGFGLLHEIPDQLALIKGLTKWAERVEHPAAVPGAINRAFDELGSGRPRPVELEIPMDVLPQVSEVTLLDGATPHTDLPVDDDAINKAAELLGNARNPMIFVGGGIWGAEAPLESLAEMLQAPVVMSRSALGALSDEHYLAQRYPVAHRMWPEVDVVLAVGSRLNPILPTWGMDESVKVIRIDVDAQEMTRAFTPDIAILASAEPALRRLVDATATRNVARSSREDELASRKSSMQQELRDNLTPQMAYLDAMREALPPEGIFVEELTQPGYVARLGFPVYRPRGYIGTGYQGTLGFGFATAIGAQIANPDTPVLSISGDGGFMYNVQELSTAVQQNIPLVAVVFSDGAFGNVQRMQIEDHGGKVIATDLHNPDFVKLAESFGARGVRARGPDELKALVAEGLTQSGPTLIDVPLGKTPAPWAYLQLGRAR